MLVSFQLSAQPLQDKSLAQTRMGMLTPRPLSDNDSQSSRTLSSSC